MADFVRHPEGGDTVSAADLRRHLKKMDSRVDRWIEGYDITGTGPNITLNDGYVMVNGGLIGEGSGGTATKVIALPTGSGTTTTHIWVKEDGNVESNQTGTPPAGESVKLYEVTADNAGLVTATTDLRDDTVGSASPNQADSYEATVAGVNLKGHRGRMKGVEPRWDFIDTTATEELGTRIVARDNKLQVVDIDPNTEAEITVLSDDLRNINVSIGSALGGSTGGSVIFSDAGNFGQNNTAFFWDNTGLRLGLGTNAPAAMIHARRGISAANVEARIENTSTISTAGAEVRIVVASGAAFDPFLRFSVTGAQDWAMGIDNSDADRLKIQPAGTLGGGTGVFIDTDASVTLTNLATANALVRADANGKLLVDANLIWDGTDLLVGDKTGLAASPGYSLRLTGNYLTQEGGTATAGGNFNGGSFASRASVWTGASAIKRDMSWANVAGPAGTSSYGMNLINDAGVVVRRWNGAGTWEAVTTGNRFVWGTYEPTTDVFTEWFRADTNANIGIGVNGAPQARLHVSGAAGSMILGNTDGATSITLDNGATGVSGNRIATTSYRGKNDASQQIVYVSTLADMSNATDGSEQGRFGIDLYNGGVAARRFDVIGNKFGFNQVADTVWAMSVLSDEANGQILNLKARSGGALTDDVTLARIWASDQTWRGTLLSLGKDNGDNNYLAAFEFKTMATQTNWLAPELLMRANGSSTGGTLKTSISASQNDTSAIGLDTRVSIDNVSELSAAGGFRMFTWRNFTREVMALDEHPTSSTTGGGRNIYLMLGEAANVYDPFTPGIGSYPPEGSTTAKGTQVYLGSGDGGWLHFLNGNSAGQASGIYWHNGTLDQDGAYQFFKSSGHNLWLDTRHLGGPGGGGAIGTVWKVPTQTNYFAMSAPVGAPSASQMFSKNTGPQHYGSVAFYLEAGAGGPLKVAWEDSGGALTTQSVGGGAYGEYVGSSGKRVSGVFVSGANNTAVLFAGQSQISLQPSIYPGDSTGTGAFMPSGSTVNIIATAYTKAVDNNNSVRQAILFGGGVTTGNMTNQNIGVGWCLRDRGGGEGASADKIEFYYRDNTGGGSDVNLDLGLPSDNTMYVFEMKGSFQGVANSRRNWVGDVWWNGTKVASNITIACDYTSGFVGDGRPGNKTVIFGPVAYEIELP